MKIGQRLSVLLAVYLCIICIYGCGNAGTYNVSHDIFMESHVPEYTGDTWVILNNNIPDFSEADLTTDPFEIYSDLDDLGRCGPAFANICEEIMPTRERENIGQIKPSGWHTIKYNDIVDGNYLYNRCHLIGYQLAGENANENNLITGTRWLNVQGMLPFENMVADYVKQTENHVLYRVTPIFENQNLVASGVQMEAESVEDQGEGICFNVFIFNIQPGIVIDYATGDSYESEDWQAALGLGDENSEAAPAELYIVNMKSKKFHDPECASVSDMEEKNKLEFYGDEEDLVILGYIPCKRCHP